MSGRRLRIAYLSSDPGIAMEGTKGASVHFREMARALRVEADLDVFVARENRDEPTWPDAVRVVAPRRGDGFSGEVQTLANSATMLQALSEGGDHDAVYERLSLFGVAGMAHAMDRGIPHLLEINAPLWEEAARYRSLHLRRTARSLAIDVMTHATHVTVVSRELARIVVDAGVEPGRVHVMGNGVNAEAFAAAEPADRPPALRDKPMLVFVGSLKEWHGIDFLLEAFVHARKAHPMGLWVVGEGPLGDQVQKVAQRHPDDIVFEGPVAHERIPSVLKAADAAVAPYSVDSPAYFCPLKVVEALAVGCPLIASRTTCVTDAVEGRSAELFEPGDIEDFERAVSRVVAKPRDRSRDAVDEAWSWTARARKVVELIRSSAGIALLLSALCACVTPQDQVFDRLAVGMWVEAEGTEWGNGISDRPVADEIDELDRSESNTVDKLELTGPSANDIDADSDSVTMLGQLIDLSSSTEYESLDREVVDPFPVSAGDWVRLKTRVRPNGEVYARTIRDFEARNQFKIEGEITELNPDTRMLRIGSVPVLVSEVSRANVLADLGARDNPLALFLADEQKNVPFTFRPLDNLFIGGEFAARGEYDDDFDLVSNDDDDRGELNGSGKLTTLWVFDEQGSFAFLEGRLGRRRRYRENDNDTYQTINNITFAYAYIKVSEPTRFQVGRQDYDEEREWLYDATYDGVRLYYRPGAFTFEASANIGTDVFTLNNETEDSNLYTGLVRYFVDDDTWFTAYAVKRTDDTGNNFEPLLVGVRSFSRPWAGLGHWLELAHASGSDGARDIDGYAVDVGLYYRFDLPLRPTLTAGYAFGSGEPASSNSVGFRQTGIQDNNGKFGGVTSFRYYGEVLDPELSNLQLTTFGVGIRPANSWSLDWLFHTYGQDVAQPTLVDTNLRANPTGLDIDIGWGTDLVFGYRYYNRMTFEALVGRFDPGEAFAQQDSAYLFQFTIRYKF